MSLLYETRKRKKHLTHWANCYIRSRSCNIQKREFVLIIKFRHWWRSESGRNGEKPPDIAYAFRMLNSTEKNYCTIEKEFLAITYCINHFVLTFMDAYLLWSRIINPWSGIVWKILYLLCGDVSNSKNIIIILYIKRRKYSNADVLFRNPIVLNILSILPSCIFEKNSILMSHAWSVIDIPFSDDADDRDMITVCGKYLLGDRLKELNPPPMIIFSIDTEGMTSTLPLHSTSYGELPPHISTRFCYCFTKKSNFTNFF